MDYSDVRGQAFLDELEKIAVSHGRMTVPKTREGRRPISVDNLLKKEKDSELYKSTGDAQKIAKGMILPDGSGFFTATVGKKKKANQVPFVTAHDPGSAKTPRKKGEVPSREDMDELPKLEDRRASAATVPGPGVALHDIGVSNTDRA